MFEIAQKSDTNLMCFLYLFFSETECVYRAWLFDLEIAQRYKEENM